MTASYTCDIGYSLQGVATRECMQDGTGWDTASPTCSKLQIGICLSYVTNMQSKSKHVLSD